jgi:hypothetical protein
MKLPSIMIVAANLDLDAPQWNRIGRRSLALPHVVNDAEPWPGGIVIESVGPLIDALRIRS